MSRTQSDPLEVAHEEIASRAYELYVQRGSIDGYDLEDWLVAEEELARQRAQQQLPRRPRLPTQPEAA